MTTISYRFKGTLVHQDKFEMPLHHVKVELRDGGFLGSKLAEGYTDARGRFEFTAQLPPSAAVGSTPIVLRVYEEPWVARGKSKPRRLLDYIGLKGFSNAGLFDFGKVRVPYWEYEPDWRFPTPLADKDGNPPQDFNPGFKGYFIRRNLWILAKSKLLASFARLLALVWKPSLAFIQSCYGKNLTMKQEAIQKGTTRADAWFADRTLNGFNPALPCETDTPGVYSVAYDWAHFDSDGVHDVPRVEGRFKLEGGRFVPTEICLAFRVPGETSADSPFGEPRCFRPGDAEWDEAKRVFRCAWVVAGEIETHLCQSHLNVGQYATAAFRNLRQNPVRELLFPHLQEVVAINNKGADAIFGAQGVLSKNTPLTPNACWRRLLWRLGQLDWVNWKPRAPLTQSHRYAQAANLFWNVVTEYVDKFFAAKRDAIVATWHEVFSFSFDLVQHAVEQEAYPHARPYDHSEISADPGLVRGSGTKSAVSPITLAEANPPAADIENLKQVCRYAIFHATFFHGWTHDAQVDDCGEVTYASLGLRNGSLGPENDERVAPVALEASEQLFMVNMLSQTVRGLILSNDLDDLNPEFVSLLQSREQAFKAIGVDAGRFRSRINI